MTTQLRIGDAEREQAASQLAEHYAVGRIDSTEHAERLDQIWAARTQADLDPVFADLPGHARPAPARTAVPRPAPTRRRPRLPLPLLVLAVVLVAVTVMAHLPIVLLGLGVWFLVSRGGCHSRSWQHGPRTRG